MRRRGRRTLVDSRRVYIMSYYQKHLFFCTNFRDNGKKCCEQNQASAFCQYAKLKLKELKLTGRGKIRVSAAGCLGRCKQGPNIVIYPDNVWYHYQSQRDIDEIIEKHLLSNEIVTHLLLEDNNEQEHT